MQSDGQVPLWFIRFKTTIHEVADRRGEGFQAFGLGCHFGIVASGNKPFAILLDFENQFVHSARLHSRCRAIKHTTDEAGDAKRVWNDSLSTIRI
jgi:hypothetical protein